MKETTKELMLGCGLAITFGFTIGQALVLTYGYAVAIPICLAVGFFMGPLARKILGH